MSKKIVVIVIMVVIGCGVCLGRGMYEKEVVIKLECADNVTLNKYFKINIEPIWGKYKITILEKVHAWAVIYDDDCTVSDAFNNNDELNQILNRYKDTNPTGTDYNYEIISEYHLSDAAHYNSTYLKTKNTIGNPQFYIDKCGVKKFCKIILFHDSGTYDCYIFEIIPEFFMGEFELFGESENEENYNKKCADFLQKFIDDTSFHKILKDIFGELIANLIDYEKLKDGGYYDSFTYAMSSHIKKDYEIRELNKNGQMIQLHVPYLDFSEVNPCEALYSEDRNKYITAYMHYLYDIKKPVLSYIIQERLNGRYEESYSINKNFLHYDYTHYEEIDAATGKEIAKNALRYLTWGVEYTPCVPAYKDYIKGFSTNKVYYDYYYLNYIFNNKYKVNFSFRPTNYFKEFIVTDSNCFYESYKIYEENKNIIDKLISEGILTTPFNYDNNNNRLLGNPIPYVAGGIDSPRTFNFKMRKQSQARGKYIQNLSVNEEKKKDLLNQSDNTSAGIFMEIQNNALYNGYVNELDVLHTIFKKAIVTGQIFTYSIDGEPYKEMVSDWKKDGNDTYNNLQLHCKPFLPGSNINMKSGYCNNTNSLYYPDKITGVDSIGIVCGVLSMLNVNCILNNKDDSTLGVVNLFNIDSGDNLDEYFNFSSLTAGLEYEGNVNYKYQPVFYPFNKNGINASYLNGDYRFTISDFEKNTIIVPDMKDIRPGDILIKYNYNFNTIPYMVTGYIAGFKDDEIHVGIVVLVDEINDNDSLEMSMDKIYLISVNRNFQMTTLGRWGNENGFGKFAYDPFQYQIRRFLKVKKEKCKKIEDLTQRKEKDPWECVQEYPHHLECHLELPDDEYATSVIKPGLTPDPDDKNKKELEYKNHWIPNTDETEMLEYVRIIINPKSEDNKDITLNDLSISFLPPVDPNFDNFDNDFNNNTLNNINTNRGKGIEICLLKKKWYTLNNLQQSQQDENIPEVKLATFLRPRIEKSGYRDRIITDLNKHVDKYEKYYNYRFYEPYENEFLTLFGSRDYNPYTYNNEDSFFTENGSPRKGALMVKRLAVDGQPPKNYLCYEENSKIYLDFGIKALEFAMPGDDFQLRFFMSGNPAVEGTVGKGDFVAVYDKKLLWRANLYIDERVNTNDGTPSGQVDWNDLNPWSNSENDWNILPSGYTGSEGGQIIELEPFTWHRLDSDLMTNKIIYGSVAYARGDQDEPQAYNEHVLTQQKQEPPDTWEEYLPGGPKFPQYDDLINGVFVPGYASWIWEYRKYIATRYQIEGELWSEWYPFPIPGEIIPTIKVTEDDGIKYCIKMETITKEQKDTLLEEIKNMYTTEIENSFPGQHINVEAEYSKIDPPWSYSAKSAGVDCVGFVFMAAGYKQENGYQYILAKLEPMKWNATVAGARQKFYDPQNLWEIIDKNEYSGKKIELNKVIPGDIIYYEDTPKTFQHVMIVNSVVYEKGTRNTDINYITLIEATLNTSFGCVINDRTIGFYNAHKWTIGRIIMTVIPTQ